MNAKLLALILLALIIINAIIITFIFIDIQVIAAPETLVTVNVVELTENHLIINTSMNLKNPNLFAIALSNFTIITNTSTGKHIGTIIIKGEYLEGNEQKIFSSQDHFSLPDANINEFYKLTTSINGKVKVRFFGIIEKTVPFNIDLESSLKSVIDQIKIPIINLNLAAQEIDKHGVILSGTLSIANTNPFPLHLHDITLNVTNTLSISYGKITIADGTVPASDSSTLPVSGRVDFKALNIQTLTINITATAGATVAGINHSIPISTQILFEVPDLTKIISLDAALGIYLQGDFLIRLRGIIITVTLQVDNPSNLPLTSHYLILKIARVENENIIVIAEKNMSECITDVANGTCVVTELTIPYRKFISTKPFQILPDYFAIIINGDFALKDVNQALPLELRGYLNPHIFTKS